MMANEETLLFQIEKRRRFRCRKGHEWTGEASDGMTFTQGKWHQTVRVCYQCLAEYVVQHFSGEDIGEEGAS